MKKILNTLLGLSIIVLFFSCEKDNMGKIDPTIITPEEDTTNVLMSFTTPAQISGDTKMSFEFDQTNKMLKRSWETGDQLIGFVKEGTDAKPIYKYFAFEGEKDGDNITWTRISGNEGYPKKEIGAILYFVFAPGKEASSFKTDGSITIDLSNQINGQLPVVMSASGSLAETEGKYNINLNFTSHLALLCIDGATLGETSSFPAENTPINYFSINGVSQKVKISPAATTICENVDTDGTGITVGQSKESDEPWEVGKNGKFSKQVFVAFPVTGTAEDDKIKISVSAETEDAMYSYDKIDSRNYSNELYLLTSKNFEKTSKSDDDIVAYLFDGNTSKGSFYVFNNAIIAANAADYNATIKLNKSITLAGDVPAFNNNNTKTITLNLNGKTITTGANRRIVVDGNDAKLIIIDDSDTGTIKAYDGAEAGAPVIAMNNAMLTINGGNFVSAPTHSVDIDAAVYAKLGATLTINGGTFTSTSSDEGAIGASSVDGSDDITQVIVNGGTINGGSDAEKTRKAIHMVRANLTIGNANDESNGPTIYGDIDIKGKTKQNTLTINKGSITSNNDNHTIDIEENVSATINGGTFLNNTQGKNAIYILSENKVDAPAASLSINGGTFTSTSTSTKTPTQRTIRVLRSNVTIGSSELNETQPIINGEIYATKGSNVSDRSVIINNGRIKCSTSQSIVQTDDNTNMKVVIKGGKFNKGFSKEYYGTSYVLDYSSAESFESENYYQVKSIEDECKAFVNGTAYNSIISAFDDVINAQEAKYIQLLKNVEFDTSEKSVSTRTIVNQNGVTFNLSGYTFTVEKGRIDVGENGSLILCSYDCEGINPDGKIFQSATGNYFGMSCAGTLTVMSGSIESNSSSSTLRITNASTSSSSPVVVISGGKISSTQANAISISSGTTTISGGEISATGSSSTVYVTGGSTTISAGKITSSSAPTIKNTDGTVNISNSATIRSSSSDNGNYAIFQEGSSDSSDGSVNITGGWFYYKSTNNKPSGIVYKKTGGSITISGGKFSKAPSSSYIQDGYQSANLEDSEKTDPYGNNDYTKKITIKSN